MYSIPYIAGLEHTISACTTSPAFSSMVVSS